jgi:hypothetical protein
MALLKKQEALCLELGNKDGLQASYGNQAGILKAWGRLEEALALLKKQEALCLELGNKDELKDYDISKGTIRFQADKAMPSALVRKLIKARIAENVGRSNKAPPANHTRPKTSVKE